jgi:hypothetical protein
MTGQTRSTSPSVGLLTDQPLPDLLTVLGHLWSNSLMAGYPSAFASDDVATSDLARNASKSRLFHTCTAARRAQWRNRFLILLRTPY